jgi:Flp pilus assembly protein TadG
MRNRHTENERGAVAVELALILPVLVMLVFGIIEFGRAYNAKIALTQAVREGARVLALGSGDPVTTTKSAAASLDPNQISVTPSSSPCTPGTSVIVTATYPLSYDIPFVSSGTFNLSATGVMRCGG